MAGPPFRIPRKDLSSLLKNQPYCSEIILSYIKSERKNFESYSRNNFNEITSQTSLLQIKTQSCETIFMIVFMNLESYILVSVDSKFNKYIYQQTITHVLLKHSFNDIIFKNQYTDYIK